jgi:hypothetical protein
MKRQRFKIIEIYKHQLLQLLQCAIAALYCYVSGRLDRLDFYGILKQQKKAITFSFRKRQINS